MMPVDTIGRELIELVQIDQDFCNNTYGVEPCTAQVYQFGMSQSSLIETSRRWNPDASDPSFTLSFRNDITSTFFSLPFNQGVGYNVGELTVQTDSGGNLAMYLCGTYHGLITNNTDDSLALWTIEYIDSTSTINTYKNGVIYNSRSGSIGPDRYPTENIKLGFNDVGVLADVSLYVNTETTNDLVLDMPINDNSNTIKDYADVDDGLLNAGLGTWSGTGQQKCFNTFATCQDKPNYDKGVKQVTFKKNQAGDIEEFTIPILNNFNVTLPELNFFSRDTKNQALGKFGKCTATFSDTIFSDNHLDPYVSERNYNPLERGTFWTKWLARNPFYEGWKIRLYDGLVGQTLAEMNVREYELEKISNPDTNGNVTIKATDLMRKLDKSKAIFPPVSNCELYDPVISGQTSIKTTGQLASYTPTPQQRRFILVGGASESDTFSTTEILSETDNGDGTFTYGVVSIGISADAGTKCENGVFWGGGGVTTTIPTVVLSLLQYVYSSSDYDGIQVVTELLKITETGQNIAHYIAKPTPVGELLAELEIEFGFVVYYDDIDQLIKVKSITDEEDPAITLDQNNDLVLGKTSSKTVSEDRFTDAYIQYNAIKDFTIEESNYLASLLQIDEEASGEDEYNGIVTYDVNTRWTLLLSTATQVAERLLTQFRDPVREIIFELDIKNDLRMAQVFKLAWRGYADIYGNDEEINWICTGRTRSRDRLKITAQEFKFNVPEA